MTDSEANVTSSSGGFQSLVIPASAGEAGAFTLVAWRTGFETSASPGFAHVATLAAMSCVTPVCASLSLPLPQLRSTSPSPASVRLAGSFLPAPRPHSAARPSAHQHSPPLAAARSAAPAFTRRFAATRQRCRKSDETPNQALQRTAPRPAHERRIFPSAPSATRYFLRPEFLAGSPAGQAGERRFSADSSGFVGASEWHRLGLQSANVAMQNVTPNQALQRTAPGVTACAAHRANRPATDPLTASSARQPTPGRLRPHRLRRPPPSLSLRSFGDSTPFPRT
jgi:hypothetical protein